MRDMYKLQRDAKRVKKELKSIHVEAEASTSTDSGIGFVKVVVTAEQEIVSIHIDDSIPREKIPALLTDALNRALKKAQVVASERMQGVMQQMGFPGAEA